MKRAFYRLLIIPILLTMISCQFGAGAVSQKTPPAVNTTEAPASVQVLPTATAKVAAAATAKAPEEPAAAPAAGGATGGIDFTPRAGQPLAEVTLQSYQSTNYPVTIDRLPVNVDGVGNPGVIAGLTDPQKQFLSRNGFVVIPSGDQQFKDIRNQVSNVFGQPYYLTVDAAYHALHVTFNDVLEALESEHFRPILARLLEAVYQKVGEYGAASQGKPLEADAQLAQAYLAVGWKLLKPDWVLDPAMEAKIAPQIAQIMSYSGKEPSKLIPGFEDDYGAYRPVGHYAGKPELEDYFRAMTWLGRVAFKFKGAQSADFKPSRAPLLITLALREANLDETSPAYQVWKSLYEVTDFMVGPSDDPGPAELNILMEQVYGPAFTLNSLADDAKWQDFLARADQLPAPKINSTFATTSLAQAAERDWRFMGQRFTPDGFIFQNLIYDKVGTQDQPRKFPSGLDVAAAFGSQPAWQTLKNAGETKYANYASQMAAMQKVINDQPAQQWLNRFYTSWLYAFRPQVAAKAEGYPPYMRTAAWAFKDINAMLGSWAELKHDTVLYAKMPEGLGGGGPPMSGPAPSYVEPNPDVFYRLGYAAATLHSGISPLADDWYNRGWFEEPADPSPMGLLPIQGHLNQLGVLANLFPKFGDIAVKELQGQPLSADDYELIQSCLEEKECMDHGMYTQNAPHPDPIPVVAAVSGYQDDVLEAGVGNLERIYVAVPLEGKLEIAQGGVFSYYEFTQPRSDRLTDQAWREKLANNPPAAPAWAAQFVLPGGKPADALAFRVGDVYIVTEKGGTPPLNLRAGPSKGQAVLSKLEKETYLTIIDGPVKNADGIWWKVHVESMESPDGWVLENAEWYERSHP